uniref:Uncharacterized protein n=1 Tax=Rhizophora mucronata TaxID=61149 RepID=A0A2P2R2S5_RHIMU
MSHKLHNVKTYVHIFKENKLFSCASGSTSEGMS